MTSGGKTHVGMNQSESHSQKDLDDLIPRRLDVYNVE